MVHVLKLIYKLYQDGMNTYSDPRTKDSFLSSSVFQIIVLMIVYHKFVKNWGPKFMENRPPFELKTILTVYNLVQIILSVRIFYLASIHLFIFGPYRFRCEPVDYSNSPLSVFTLKEAQIYFLVKVLDLLDTVFFVLRKKQSQVTFLHIYHHLIMIFGSWVGVRFLPGGHLALIVYINSFVHAFMYSYYLYALHINSQKIWWKKYVTLMQICQFVVLTLHWVVMLLGPHCGFPKKMGLLFLPQNLFMLVMFSNFYYKAYVKNKKEVVK